MKIIADENIPYVEQAFASLGDVELLPGRGMQAGQVRDADILLVRSVTRVDAGLLAGSRVRFVGSATIGFDHIDRKYLKSREIGLAMAPGCNAVSAAEYVMSALMVLAGRTGFDLREKVVGIIGCGNVGSRVLGKLAGLGVRCEVNDPPLKEQGGHDHYVELDALLQADIVTVHVPLATVGDHPTFHLLGGHFLEQLKPGAILINTARGAVVDNRALDALLEQRSDLSVVLDVWEGEPGINASLLKNVALGTPHIAGYSLDGKLRGTEMIYNAVCRHLDFPATWSSADQLPEPSILEPDVSTGDSPMDVARKIILACYDVRQDDASLRELLNLPPGQQPAGFDRLRRDYPVRREFSTIPVVSRNMNPESLELLSAVGFSIT